MSGEQTPLLRPGFRPAFTHVIAKTNPETGERAAEVSRFLRA